jgi:hypothetical protein
MTKLLQGMQLQFGTEKAAMFHKQVRDAVRAAELSHERGGMKTPYASEPTWTLPGISFCGIG